MSVFEDAWNAVAEVDGCRHHGRQGAIGKRNLDETPGCDGLLVVDEVVHVLHPGPPHALAVEDLAPFIA